MRLLPDVMDYYFYYLNPANLNIKVGKTAVQVTPRNKFLKLKWNILGINIVHQDPSLLLYRYGNPKILKCTQSFSQILPSNDAFISLSCDSGSQREKCCTEITLNSGNKARICGISANVMAGSTPSALYPV